MQNNCNNKNCEYARFPVRCVAFLVDLILVAVAKSIIQIPVLLFAMVTGIEVLTKQFLFHYSILDVLLYCLGVSYFVLFTYHGGSTLGKKLFQLKVVPKNQENLSFWQVLYRETIGRFLSGVILGIGYLVVLVDEEKRGIHDMLAETYVVNNVKHKEMQEIVEKFQDKGEKDEERGF